MGISEGNAQINYERAGSLVEEGKLPIKMEDYKDSFPKEDFSAYS